MPFTSAVVKKYSAVYEGVINLFSRYAFSFSYHKGGRLCRIQLSPTLHNKTTLSAPLESPSQREAGER